MAYLTGRGLTLTLTGNIAGSIRVRPAITGASDIDGPLPPPPGQWALGATCGFWLTFAGLHFTAVQCAVNYSGAGSGKDYGVTLTGGTGIGSDASNTGYTHYSPPYDVTRSFNGSYTFTIPCLEWQEDLTTGTFATNPTTGSAPRDLPYHQSHRRWLAMEVGATATVYVTCGGATINVSDAIVTATEIDWTIAPTVYGLAENQSNTASLDYILSWSGTGGSGNYPGSAYTHNNVETTSDGVTTVHVNGGAISCQCVATAPVTWADVYVVAARGEATIRPPRAHTVDGVVKAQQSAYPAMLTARSQRTGSPGYVDRSVSSGAWSDSQTQEWYGGFITTLKPDGSALSYLTGPSINQWQTHRSWILPSTLASASDDTAAWRIQLRGRAWNAITLAQASTMAIDAAPIASRWTAGANTTVSNSGGGIAIAASGGSGSASSSMSAATAGLKGSGFSGVSFAGYRYVQLHLTADTATTITVQLGSKTWSLAITTTPTYYYLDLRGPTNNVATTDNWETRWPVPTTDGPLSGVTAVSSFIITGIASGRTVSLENLVLLRRDHTRLTVQVPLTGWRQQNVSDANTFIRPQIIGDTDGKRSLEWNADLWQSGMTDTYTLASISDVVADINGNSGVYPTDGWTAAYLSDVGTYLTSARMAHWIGGDGLAWISGAWWQPFDIDASSTPPIPAQPLYDEFDWFPEWGDGFYHLASGAGAFGGPANLHAGLVLRASSTGVVLGAGMAPAVACYVDQILTSDGVTDGGNGTTDTRGEYLSGTIHATGPPYGRGGSGYTTTAHLGTPAYPAVARTLVTRTRHGAAFARPDTMVPSGNPWNLQDHHGRLHIAKVQASDVLYFRSNFDNPLSWDVNGVAVTASADCANPRMAYDYYQRIWITYDRPSGTCRRISDDDGATWSDETLDITGGHKSTIAEMRDHRLFQCARVGTALNARVTDSPGSITFGTLTTLTDDAGAVINIENETFHVSFSQSALGLATLTCKVLGETDVATFYSSDEDALTWKRF